MQIYERTRRELEKEARPEVWEQKNESLRILGLRTIPAPNEWKKLASASLILKNKAK